MQGQHQHTELRRQEDGGAMSLEAMINRVQNATVRRGHE